MSTGGTTCKLMLAPNILKAIAVVCMVADHSVLIFGPQVDQSTHYQLVPGLLHCIGRISAPIFFYFLQQGYMHTRNANMYTLRLLVFAALSYAPYMMYKYNSALDYRHLYCQNVLFTLLFGLLFIRIVHELENRFLKAILLVVVVLLISFCEYGVYALAYILVFDYFRDQHSKTASFIGVAAIIFTHLYRCLNFTRYTFSGVFNSFFAAENLMLILQNLSPFISVFLIFRCDYALGKRPNNFAKWFFYFFYPLHFLLLLFVRIYVMGIPLR
ncbi:MAG: conjugal transfer protein TraX [Candidatus Ancillula trichonymphae]|jgi:hypothetical protein|nr:conjugal transfer protein TraX [Candidatus Ancillula trichonymphae]